MRPGVASWHVAPTFTIWQVAIDLPGFGRTESPAIDGLVNVKLLTEVIRSLAKQLPTTYYFLLPTHYLLLTTHYLLLTTHYSLLTTHYYLLTT